MKYYLSVLFALCSFYCKSQKVEFSHYDTSYYLLNNMKIMAIDSMTRTCHPVYKIHPYDTCDNYNPCSSGGIFMMWGGSDSSHKCDSIYISDKCGTFCGTFKEWDEKKRIRDSINSKIDSVEDKENTEIFDMIKEKYPQLYEDIEKGVQYEIDKLNNDFE